MGRLAGMTEDQTTTQDPRTQHPVPEQPGQQLAHPGREAEMDPRPDHGEDSYRGSGRLIDARRRARRRERFVETTGHGGVNRQARSRRSPRN